MMDEKIYIKDCIDSSSIDDPSDDPAIYFL